MNYHELIMMTNPWVRIGFLILGLWYILRYYNGKFDGGNLNKQDMEYYEDCKKDGKIIAGIKDSFRAGKRFLKK